MKKLIILLSMCLATAALANSKVAYQEVDFINPNTQQPIKLSIWYPEGKPCDNAKLCLSESARLDQAVLLSHGAMGSARELIWVGYVTASQGFITVGINHFGESWAYGKDSIQPHAATKIWRRASEISAAIDLLQRNQASSQEPAHLFSHQVNWQQLTAIGFSSGGSTVITLGGGKYNPEQAVTYCASERSKGDLGCRYAKNLPEHAISIEEASRDYRDERIVKVVALDPAAGPMTTTESLSNMNIPVLIIGAKQNDFLPFANHAGYYASTIPNASLYRLDNKAGHFVFIDSCQHEHKAMGISLCKDKEGVDREKIHQQLYPRLFQFIYSGT
ncbi:MAG: putative dienelactone hydrolase [Alteromonadaceae bacterium]|jgi:predicted dienelactone hydrolase